MVQIIDKVKALGMPCAVSVPGNIDSSIFANNLICHQLKQSPKNHMDIFVTEYGSQNYTINPVNEMFASILN